VTFQDKPKKFRCQPRGQADIKSKDTQILKDYLHRIYSRGILDPLSMCPTCCPLSIRINNYLVKPSSGILLPLSSPSPLPYHHIFALSKTALSCTQATQTLPSFVLISPLKFAVLFPAATTRHSTTHSVPMGTGRRYVQLSVRLTCPPSRKPGLAIVRSAVEVRESSNVAAQPPCKFPPLLHSSGAAMKDQEVDCDSVEAETKVAYWRGRVSKQTLSPTGGGAVNSL